MKRMAFFASMGIGSMAFAQPVAHDCVLWMRADQGVVVDGDGRVMEVQDQSGSGRTMTQGTSWARPMLVADVVGGKPALRFFGSQFLDISGQVLSSDQSTIIAVVNDTRTDGSFREILSNWNWGNMLTSYFFGTTSLDPAGPGTTRARLTDDVGGANQGQAGVGSISDRTRHFILTGVCGVADARVYQARTLVAMRETPVSPRNFTTPWFVGVQGNLYGEYWVGDIVEIQVYGAELTRCELDLVYDDLNARYGLAPCIPDVREGPVDATTCTGGTVEFTVSAGGGTCNSNFTYQWFIDHAAAEDGGPAGSGTVVHGATSPTLVLGGLGASDVVEVYCEVSNACGTTASAVATGRVCAADFNCDGGVDGSDVDSFFLVWESGESGADLNADGGVDFQDVEAFFTRWEQGC